MRLKTLQKVTCVGFFAKALIVFVIGVASPAIYANTLSASQLLALGVSAFENNDFKKSKEHLLKALDLKTIHKAHVYFLLASIAKAEKDTVLAVFYYNKMFAEAPPLNIFFQARLDLAEIATEAKQHKKALDNLLYLERRQRQDFRYPEIVWRLIGAELNLNRRVQACRWARKMYIQYPGHVLAKDWGVDLHLNKYQGQSVGCVVSAKEMRQRNRRLILSGLHEKAKNEMNQLIARFKSTESLETDLMRVEALESQGFSEEALKILIPHYQKNKNSFNFLSVFARSAARSGEYSAAIGAYYRAYQLSPRSKEGRQALFHSAFLSYQAQDYDGAQRRFKEIIEKHSNSGLARDSRWHLAWVHYLRGQYSEAEKKFSDLTSYTSGQGRKRRTVRDDRARYWLAMTYLKSQKFSEAKALFTKIAESSYETYYALLAQHRLQMISKMPLREIASSPQNENEAQKLLKGVPLPTPVEFSNEVNLRSSDESEESEESLTTLTPKETQDELAEVSVDEPVTLDPVAPLLFRESKLNERFDRAQELAQVGLHEWARWELFEIEKRTSQKNHLKTLIDIYKKIGSYNRAAYISEIYFGQERLSGIHKLNRNFWESSYPRAYAQSVEKSAKRFGVEPELVWAIMRAESHYNKDVTSPVGARGLMQVMPYTGERVAQLLEEKVYNEDMLYHPDHNIRWGVSYLSRLQSKFSYLAPFVAAGYNAGPHRVFTWLNSFGRRDMDEFIEHIPFLETRNYVKKVLKNYAVYKSLYSDTKNSLAFLSEPIPARIQGRHMTRENWDPLN